MYRIERERFLQMYDDIEIAIRNLERGNKDMALRYLNSCHIMMMTENDFYGKETPLDLLRTSQRVTV